MPRRVTVAAVSAGIESTFTHRPPTAQQHVRRALDVVETILPLRPDLIMLSEYFHCAGIPGRYDQLALTADDELIAPFRRVALQHQVHIICPIAERRDNGVFNTALWINRQGQIAGRYDKMHLIDWELDTGVCPGADHQPLWTLDFGRVGVRTCFDINWPQGWVDLREAGAELVLWPSAYAGGRLLQAHACLNRVFILTATWPKLCRLYDITGTILAEGGRLTDFLVATVDLERRLFHWDFQGERVPQILAKYPRDVQIEVFHEKGWFALQSLHDDLSVDHLVKEFGLLPIDDYLVSPARRRHGLPP